MSEMKWVTVNPGGRNRVIVTKELPGEHWKQLLEQADCRIEVCTDSAVLSKDEIIVAIGARCDGAIGQLTEDWDAEVFAALRAAGGRVYSNGAVGFNNVDVDGATAQGIPVGNTPGVLTETTAEMAVALTFAAGRRVTEADRFMRAGKYEGWLPTMFLGQRFVGKTVGVIGAGRIGSAYARMMVEGHKMDLVYYDLVPNEALEQYVADYSAFLVAHGEPPLTCRRMDSVADVLRAADVVSIHTVLDESTHHLIDADALAVMKPDAVLVNSSRGPVVDETALVEHCRSNPEFRAGLDVFEDEPAMKPGLADLDNVVIVPHIASATVWTREGMSSLAAANVAAILQGFPVWQDDDIKPFLEGDVPQAAPSIVNAADLGLLES
jgi:hydroxypyruvate reductase 1